MEFGKPILKPANPQKNVCLLPLPRGSLNLGQHLSPQTKKSRGGNEKVLLVDHQDTYFCPKSNINLGMVQWAYHGKSLEAITFSIQFEPTDDQEASTFLGQ